IVVIALLEEFRSERDVIRRAAPTFATQVRTQSVDSLKPVGFAQRFEDLIGLLLIEALHGVELLPLAESRNGGGPLPQGRLLRCCGYMQLMNNTRRYSGCCDLGPIFRRLASCMYMQLTSAIRGLTNCT